MILDLSIERTNEYVVLQCGTNLLMFSKYADFFDIVKVRIPGSRHLNEY